MCLCASHIIICTHQYLQSNEERKKSSDDTKLFNAFNQVIVFDFFLCLCSEYHNLNDILSHHQTASNFWSFFRCHSFHFYWLSYVKFTFSMDYHFKPLAIAYSILVFVCSTCIGSILFRHSDCFPLFNVLVFLIARSMLLIWFCLVFCSSIKFWNFFVLLLFFRELSLIFIVRINTTMQAKNSQFDLYFVEYSRCVCAIFWCGCRYILHIFFRCCVFLFCFIFFYNWLRYEYLNGHVYTGRQPCTHIYVVASH